MDISKLHKDDIDILDNIIQICLSNNIARAENLPPLGNDFLDCTNEIKKSNYQRYFGFIQDFKVANVTNDHDLSYVQPIETVTLRFHQEGGFRKLYEDHQKDIDFSNKIREQKLNEIVLTKWHKKSYWWTFSFAIAGFILALSAFILTVLPQKADISYSVRDIYSITERDSISKTSTLVRLIISNNGERSVTIQSLIKNKTDKGLIGFNEEKTEMNIERSVFMQQIKKDLFNKYSLPIKDEPRLVFSFNQGLDINRKIEPDQDIQINLVFTQNDQFTTEIDYITFDATLILSDKTTLPIYFEFDSRIKRISK